MTPEENRILRPKQAARFLGVSVNTINRLRANGSFPSPVALGKQAIGYELADLLAWREARKEKAA